MPVWYVSHQDKVLVCVEDPLLNFQDFGCVWTDALTRTVMP